MNKKQWIGSGIFYGLSAFGISLTIKASVGVSSFNALNVTLATMSGIKVGTITTAINLGFLAACWLLDRRQTSLKQKGSEYLIMFFALLAFGYLINGFVYYFLASLHLTNYWSQLAALIGGILISGTATGQVLRLQVLKFPIEHWCHLLAQRSRWTFKQYRYGVDAVCILGALLLAISLGLPLAVREGTVISFFLLSGAIAWSKERDLTLGIPTRQKRQG